MQASPSPSRDAALDILKSQSAVALSLLPKVEAAPLRPPPARPEDLAGSASLEAKEAVFALFRDWWPGGVFERDLFYRIIPREVWVGSPSEAPEALGGAALDLLKKKRTLVCEMEVTKSKNLSYTSIVRPSHPPLDRHVQLFDDNARRMRMHADRQVRDVRAFRRPGPSS